MMTKCEEGTQYFHYNNVLMLKNVDKEKFVEAIEQGFIYVDFDARSGHYHGTKFRIKSKNIPMLYAETVKVL